MDNPCVSIEKTNSVIDVFSEVDNRRYTGFHKINVSIAAKNVWIRRARKNGLKRISVSAKMLAT